MVTELELSLEERIKQLLQHLGIQRAHFGASVLADWIGLVNANPESILSLTVASPQGFNSQALEPIEERLLVVTGDSGPAFRQAHDGVSSLRKATHVILKDCFNTFWTDIAREHTEDLGSAISDFVLAKGAQAGNLPPDLTEGEGEAAGINYRIRGSGPPLVLLPLGLSPSQWEPLIPKLAEKYCTITLGGVHVGTVRNLEERARRGYRPMVRLLIEGLGLQNGDSVLDVGCGSGAHDRFLARLTDGRNSITAVDYSPYMIREAPAIAKSEGLEGLINFQEGNAENLPFPDNSFDVVMSVTVMEEVNADLMFPELVRVAKPGGRIGVAVRAVDLPWVVNLPVSTAIKQKVEVPGVMGGGANKDGCGDLGLYSRFSQAGLTSVNMFPYLMTNTGGSFLQNWESQAFSVLTGAEQEEWRTARARAQADGTFFMASPFHCAIGTKPL